MNVSQPGLTTSMSVDERQGLKIAILGEKASTARCRQCRTASGTAPGPGTPSWSTVPTTPRRGARRRGPASSPPRSRPAPPPPQPRASDQALGGSTAAPRPPRGPAAPSRPPRGGEPSAGAARWRPRGSGDAGRTAAAAPPRPRGVEPLSAAPVGTAVAGGGGGVCLRRQRGPSAAPLRPPAPSHAVVMEEPRWRPWPTRGASGRSTTTSA